MARVQRPGDQTWSAAARWLDENGHERFLAWLHLFDPHTPYEPPEPYRAQYSGRPYDGEIAYSDSIVGHAIEWLRAKNILDKTIVVLLSDHGEGLGDHGEDEHGLLAYDSTLRVPWIIRVPQQATRGDRIEQEVGLVDVMPTILGLLGLPVPASLDGLDVSSFIASGTNVSASPLYAETYYPRLQFNWSELTSVRDGRYKFIRAPRPELYEYRSDSGESRNLVTEHPDIAARFGRPWTVCGNRPKQFPWLSLWTQKPLADWRRWVTSAALRAARLQESCPIPKTVWKRSAIFRARGS